LIQPAGPVTVHRVRPDSIPPRQTAPAAPDRARRFRPRSPPLRAAAPRVSTCVPTTARLDLLPTAPAASARARAPSPLSSHPRAAAPRPCPIFAVVAPPPAAILPEHRHHRVSLPDPLLPAADVACAAATAASSPLLTRARRRASDHGGRRGDHRWLRLVETKPAVASRAAAVAGGAGELVRCGGGRSGSGLIRTGSSLVQPARV
jgi:hypothetical protein